MARQTNRLTALGVRGLTKPGRYADGDGLYLVVDDAGAKRWICFFQWRGKRREMGLGSAGQVSLSEARGAARAAKEAAKAGRDPIDARRRTAAFEASIPTFGAVADELIRDLAPRWRSEKTADSWKRSFDSHARSLRARPVDTISTEDVLDVLKPMWETKAESAAKLRIRIEAVLDAARVKGWRTTENPARWRGHLAHLLPKRVKLARGHFPAMPFDQMPAFMRLLRESRGMSARALEWTILTAGREGMTLGATWGEIDQEARVWTVPGERMKMGLPHRVPLSEAALAVLDLVRPPEFRPTDLVFPSARQGRPMSNMAMDMLLRDLAPGYVPHGFRSSFRDWAGERTAFPREVAEAALAHSVGDQVERAYRRGDALEKRRDLMEAWGAFATGSLINARERENAETASRT